MLGLVVVIQKLISFIPVDLLLDTSIYSQNNNIYPNC